MSSSAARFILVAALFLSGCNNVHTVDQGAANGAAASDQAVEDADARAVRLEEQASQLDAAAATTRGSSRQALDNEADTDLSEAISVERQGEEQAENIAAATERGPK